jgi:hypothetical protein
MSLLEEMTLGDSQGTYNILMKRPRSSNWLGCIEKKDLDE